MEYNVRSGDLWADNVLAVREADGGGLTLDGYAVRFGSASLPMGPRQIAEADSLASFARLGAKRFREIVMPGALSKALSEKPDVTLRYQHNMNALPMGRTTSGTLTLEQDDLGLRVQATLPAWASDVAESVRRGDVTGMSIRFGKVLEKWSTEAIDGAQVAVRRLQEIRLGGELSLVDFPAFPATSAAIRALADELDVAPDVIESALAVLREPEAKLTGEQKELLVAAVNARTDNPVIDTAVVAKQAEMRERLNALAR